MCLSCAFLFLLLSELLFEVVARAGGGWGGDSVLLVVLKKKSVLCQSYARFMIVLCPKLKQHRQAPSRKLHQGQKLQNLRQEMKLLRWQIYL